RRVTKNTPGAVKVDLGWSKIWYGRYKAADGKRRRVPLCSDKTASKQMLAKLVTDAKLATHGLGDAFEEHRNRPLREHLEDYHRYLLAKGNTEKHARQTCTRAQAILDGCQFVFLAELSASLVVQWLADERQAGRLSIQTSNYYLRDVKSFC